MILVKALLSHFHCCTGVVRARPLLARVNKQCAKHAAQSCNVCRVLLYSSAVLCRLMDKMFLELFNNSREARSSQRRKAENSQ